MKKFSITKLESARQNPIAFAKSLKPTATDSGIFFGRSQFIRWQDAVNEYHKTNDLSEAVSYLEKSFSQFASNSKNRKSLESYLISLDAYATELIKKGNIFLKKESVKIILNSKSMITGRVPLSFMNNKGGFSVYFFSKSSAGWESELRFPIIQSYFAEETYGTDLDMVEVGVFSIQDNIFIEKIYSLSEIKDAKIELKSIGKTIFRIL